MRKLSRGAYEDTKGSVRAAEAMVEVALLTGVYYLVWRNLYDFSMFAYKGKYVLVGVYAVLLFVLFENTECSKFGQLHWTDLAVGQFISLLLVNGITYFQLSLIANRMVSVSPMLVLTVLQAILAILAALAFDKLYYRLYPPHDMLLIFGSESALGLKFKMDERREKYRITGVIPVQAGLERILEETAKYDAVILNEVPAALRNDILRFCYRYRIRVYLAPDLTDIMIRGAKNNTLFDTPLLTVKGTGLSPVQRVVKRTMDIVLCAIAMVVAAPIMLAVAAAIKLEDGGPVFYKQDRLTRGGREFKILKFRSMIVDAEKYAGAVLASGDDPRITRVGKVIRATRLDELPQLLNILKGDMSIVGPRPERKCLADEITKELPEFPYRLKVRGGLTGYAQIFGKYNTSAYDKLRLDLIYIENYSLLLDFKLIILTLRIIFSKDSTEGIDKAQEIREKSRELLEELQNQEQ